MKYALDTEFIDTPSYSGLLSLGLAAEDGRILYLEFGYPDVELTPWLRENVIPHLTGAEWQSFPNAWEKIKNFCGSNNCYDTPQIWAYYGVYDWYWLCRIAGGMMNLPRHWPMRHREAADNFTYIPNVFGPPHHALNDARSLLAALERG